MRFIARLCRAMSQEVMPSFGITSLICTLFDPEYLGSLEANVVVPNRPNVPEFLRYGTSPRWGLKMAHRLSRCVTGVRERLRETEDDRRNKIRSIFQKKAGLS